MTRGLSSGLALALVLLASPLVQAQYVAAEAGPFSANANDGSRYLSIPITSNLTQYQRLIVMVVSDPTGSAPVVTDPNGNAYTADRTSTNPANVRLNVFSALQSSPLTSGQVVTVDFGATPATAKAAVAMAFNGLLRNSSALDRTIAAPQPNPPGPPNGADNVAAIATGDFANATRYPYELVLHVVGVEGTAALGDPVAGITVGAGNNPAAPNAGGSAASNNSNGTTVDDVGVLFTWNQVTAQGNYGGAFDLSPARSAAAVTVSYYGGPSQVVVTPASGTTFVASSTSCAPFTATLRNVYGTAVPPTANTNIQFTSNSPVDQLFNSAVCGGGATATLNLSFNNTQSARTLSLRDTRRSTPLWTLTGTRTSGNNNIAAGSATYTVTSAAAARVHVVTPGRTFTEGTGVTGLASNIVVGVDAPITLVATDAFNNIRLGDPAFDGTETVTFTQAPVTPTPGFCAAAGCVTPANPVNVTFVQGVATGTPFVRYAATGNNRTLSATVSGVSGPVSGAFDIVAAQPTLSFNRPVIYSGKADGGILVRVNNTTGGGVIDRVTITRPTNAWSFISGAVDGFTGPNPGCVLGTVNATTVQFNCAPGLTAGLGGTVLDIRATNTGSAYPVPSGDTAYTVQVSYRIGGNTSNVDITPLSLRMPLAAPLLPLAVRSEANARPQFFWSNTDLSTATPPVTLTTPRDSAGVLVTRGAVRPVDGVTYAPPYPASPAVLCGSTGEFCAEDPGVTQDDLTQTYSFFNHDAPARIYSPPAAVALPARPTVPGTFVARSTGAFTLTPPAVRRGTATTDAVVTVPMQNRSVFFLWSTGSERRRAEAITANVQRRASMATVGGTENRAFLGDTGGTVYRMDPDGVEATTSFSVGQAVGSSINVMLRSSMASVSTLYSTDTLFLGTNAANNNTVRALRPALGPSDQIWSLALPNTADTVRSDLYLDYTRGWLLVPVVNGGGGIVGIDLSAAAGATSPPPPPAAWSSTRRVLGGTNFSCQPRKILDRIVVGSTTGTLANSVVVFHPDTIVSTPAGSSASFVVEGPVKAIIPSGTNGVIYVTTNGRVGRLLLSTSPLALTRDTAFTVFNPGGQVGGATTYLGQNAVYVTAPSGGVASIFKLDMTTGLAVGAPRTLDGTLASEVSFDSYEGLLFVGTDTGSLWGLPVF